MTGKLNVFSASMTGRYMPMSSRIKEPLIPGRIMAQMAMAPEKKTKGRLSEPVPAFNTPITTAIAVPTSMPMMGAMDQCLTKRPHSHTLAAISPKKKLQMSTG